MGAGGGGGWAGRQPLFRVESRSLTVTSGGTASQAGQLGDAPFDAPDSDGGRVHRGILLRLRWYRRQFGLLHHLGCRGGRVSTARPTSHGSPRRPADIDPPPRSSLTATAISSRLVFATASASPSASSSPPPLRAGTSPLASRSRSGCSRGSRRGRSRSTSSRRSSARSVRASSRIGSIGSSSWRSRRRWWPVERGRRCSRLRGLVVLSCLGLPTAQC